MGRSTISEQDFSASTVVALSGVFDVVWTEVADRATAGDVSTVQAAIADALIALAKASQLDDERLKVYARHKAMQALTPA
jgi:hypothetical protein